VERHLFVWILVGLVIGLLGKLVVPGREPGGFVLSLLLGMAGALAGGMLAFAGSVAPPPVAQSAAVAGLGALLLTLLYRVVIAKRLR
jgi:uncharacterized membrane protein YeaQ/YmgE (transglycosylase-associated protein family)